jgi:hypothetical protein
MYLSRNPTIPDLFCTEDNEEPLEFCHQRQLQRLLRNLARANTNRFVTFVTFCKNIPMISARPAATSTEASAVRPYPISKGNYQ